MLDESAEVVAMTATPWAGLLVITALPWRFLQVIFLDQLFEVGERAANYGNLLGATANMTVASIVIALWGRAVYARACRLAHQRGVAPGREAWRVPAPALASYILTASAALAIGYISLFTCLGYIVVVMFAGLAIGTMELNDRVSLVQPFRLIARHASSLILFSLLFVLFCGMCVALVNLAAASGLVVWATGALGAFDTPHWPLLFSGENRRFVLLLIAGAIVAIEPFWIAVHVVFVRKAGAQERGDDLRAWLEELRRTS